MEAGACQVLQESVLVTGCLPHIKGVSPAVWAPETKDQDKQLTGVGFAARKMAFSVRHSHPLREPNPGSSRASSNNTDVNRPAARAVYFSPNIKTALHLKHPPNNSFVLGGRPGTLSNLPALQLGASSHPLVTVEMSEKPQPRFM